MSRQKITRIYFRKLGLSVFYINEHYVIGKTNRYFICEIGKDITRYIIEEFNNEFLVHKFNWRSWHPYSGIKPYEPIGRKYQTLKIAVTAFWLFTQKPLPEKTITQ